MLCRIKPKKNPNNGQIDRISTIDWETMQRLPNKPGNLAGESDDLDDDPKPDFSDLKS